MIGLKLSEQLAHPWAERYCLKQVGPDELRPQNMLFRDLVCLKESDGALALCVVEAALRHPSTAPELSRFRWEFLLSNLAGDSEQKLTHWLEQTEPESWKVGERQLDLIRQGGEVHYRLKKARARFWPFS